MTNKKQIHDFKAELGRNAAIISCLTMALWAGMICFVAIVIPEPQLLLYALPYVLALYLSWQIFQNKMRSGTFKRLAILYNIVGVGSVIFFVFVYFTFIHNFKGM